MLFNLHSNLEGRHSILSPSSWRWINDDEDGLIKRLCSQYATEIGTILHNVAYKHIKYRIKLHKYDKKNVMLELLTQGIPGVVIDTIDFDGMFETLMNYVNDGIGYKMEPEVVLAYSNYAFGTADTIQYSEKDRFLRIHDFKSGSTPAHIEQLLVYEALFCLEYKIKPTNFESELRIYQSGQVLYHNPAPEEIMPIIDTIVSHDKLITRVKEEV